MSGERRGGGFGGAFMVLIVVGFIAKFWLWILLVLAAISAGVLLWLWHERALAPSAARRRADAALVVRADQQHAWVIAGDDRGLYGEYRPAV